MSLEEKRQLYRHIKQTQPELGDFIDTVATEFPGAKVTFVQLGAETWGERGTDFPAITGPLFEKKTLRGKR
jgi:hypothetical protein